MFKTVVRQAGKSLESRKLKDAWGITKAFGMQLLKLERTLGTPYSSAPRLKIRLDAEPALSTAARVNRSLRIDISRDTRLPGAPAKLGLAVKAQNEHLHSALLTFEFDF